MTQKFIDIMNYTMIKNLEHPVIHICMKYIGMVHSELESDLTTKF